mmetsp:Transcript_4927/g.6532  ORF Transcript_4927/g.6532 Transcript_4927/m.6532 type:complete len:141 (+) Transcript_4927:806-1228(+)
MLRSTEIITVRVLQVCKSIKMLSLANVVPDGKASMKSYISSYLNKRNRLFDIDISEMRHKWANEGIDSPLTTITIDSQPSDSGVSRHILSGLQLGTQLRLSDFETTFGNDGSSFFCDAYEVSNSKSPLIRCALAYGRVSG